MVLEVAARPRRRLAHPAYRGGLKINAIGLQNSSYRVFRCCGMRPAPTMACDSASGCHIWIVEAAPAARVMLSLINTPPRSLASPADIHLQGTRAPTNLTQEA